jgi:hypothetical protein
MKAIVVTDEVAGTRGMRLAERPKPQAAINDVVVQVHASGFVPTELAWPLTWTDRLDRGRTPSIPGHELAGVINRPRLWHDGAVGGTAGVRPHRLVSRRRAAPPSGQRRTQVFLRVEPSQTAWRSTSWLSSIVPN